MPTNEIDNLRERLKQGVDYFNREYFFEAHDEIEELWMDARKQTARDLFHGLVNLATGFYHYRMQNLKGMQSQLNKGVNKLSNVPPFCYGINVRKLLEEVRPYIRKDDKNPNFPEPLPQIEFDESGIPH